MLHLVLDLPFTVLKHRKDHHLQNIIYIPDCCSVLVTFRLNFKKPSCSKNILPCCHLAIMSLGKYLQLKQYLKALLDKLPLSPSVRHLSLHQCFGGQCVGWHRLTQAHHMAKTSLDGVDTGILAHEEGEWTTWE